jgi:uncharacterized membrane protein YoaK (UPF0700 family)
MSSLDIAASPPIRRDETVQVSLLLAFAGGYLDAYAWIIHGVIANAQTAKLVLLWVHGVGAAVGAYAAKSIPDLALGIPLLALLIVLFQCEVRSDEERT